MKVNPDLDGNTVNVIPDPRGPGHGVRVEVGPHATPTDVLLHAHTIQTMQRYKGLLGKLRQLHDWFTLTTVGSAGWEAKLELEKLPGIIHERMQRLAEGNLTPEATARIVDEINHLSGEIDKFQKVLDNPELRDAPGRGFVAMSSKITGPEIEGCAVRGRRPHATGDAQGRAHARSNDSPLNEQRTRPSIRSVTNGRRKVASIDAWWCTTPRTRSRPSTRKSRWWTRRPLERTGEWVKRGSESSGKHGGGVVGEKASWRTVKEGSFGGMVDKRRNTRMQRPRRRLPARGACRSKRRFLRNESNNGFDGAFLRINEDGTATLVVVEAKNQPSGLTKDSFTAVVGDQFQTEPRQAARDAETKTPAAALGLSPKDRARMLEALNADSLNVEIQIHTTPETHLGHRDHPSSSILEHIETSVKDVNPDQPHQSRSRADGSEDHGTGVEGSAEARRHRQTFGASEAAGGRWRQRRLRPRTSERSR